MVQFEYFPSVPLTTLSVEVLSDTLKEQLENIDGVQYYPNEGRLLVISFNDNQLKSEVDAIVNTHDPNARPQRELDLDQVKNALQNLRDFRDNPSPTNAQSIATIKLLCRAILYLAKNIYGWE